MIVTQAPAATKKVQSQPRHAQQTAVEEHRPGTLTARLDRKLAAAHRYRGAIRFFKTHRQLMTSTEHGETSARALRHARRRLAQLTATIAALRKAIDTRADRARAARSPTAAICEVFGRYCREAVAVARCESRLQPDARNGQYLGLFQMSSRARHLYGHGPSALAQALAAHEYFVQSGRDWSPWACRWAAA